MPAPRVTHVDVDAAPIDEANEEAASTPTDDTVVHIDEPPADAGAAAADVAED